MSTNPPFYLKLQSVKPLHALTMLHILCSLGTEDMVQSCRIPGFVSQYPGRVAQKCLSLGLESKGAPFPVAPVGTFPHVNIPIHRHKCMHILKNDF